jgi:hypothetical protein
MPTVIPVMHGAMFVMHTGILNTPRVLPGVKMQAAIGIGARFAARNWIWQTTIRALLLQKRRIRFV